MEAAAPSVEAAAPMKAATAGVEAAATTAVTTATAVATTASAGRRRIGRDTRNRNSYARQERNSNFARHDTIS